VGVALKVMRVLVVWTRRAAVLLCQWPHAGGSTYPTAYIQRFTMHAGTARPTAERPRPAERLPTRGRRGWRCGRCYHTAVGGDGMWRVLVPVGAGPCH
jgi:hypothetical protein